MRTHTTMLGLGLGLLGVLLVPRVGHAQCFNAAASAIWPNNEIVYELDRTALLDAASTPCLQGDLEDDYLLYEVDTGIVTIEEWFLAGLGDWLYGDPNVDQPLSYRERVGDEEPYVLVTSICEIGGSDFSNSVSVRNDIPGHGGEWVRVLNLRPKTADPVRFEETVRHELGHVLGLQHAHSRPDRDLYLSVHADAGSEYAKWTTSQCAKVTYNLPFDYSSIMLYSPRPLEGETCTPEDPAGCAMIPLEDDEEGTHWQAMENRFITASDRWAVRLHYAQQRPSRVGVFNPVTSMYAMARMYPWNSVDKNAYAIGDVNADPEVTTSFLEINGVFDRDLSSSSAVMVAGDWTDPAADGTDLLGVLSLERSGRGYALSVQLDEDEDMLGEDELPWLVDASAASVAFVGDFDGDPETRPALAIYDAAMDTFTYDLDGDDIMDVWVTGFFSDSFSPYPVAADLLGNGWDSLCLLYQDLGIFICDTDGDDEADFGTVFTARLGEDIYPVVGDWNGDGRDDLGIYDAAERVFELDRDMDHTISGVDAHGLSMDLVFSPSGSAPTAEDVTLKPFAGRFADAHLTGFGATVPWADEWCDTIDGEAICDDPWVICWSLKAQSGGFYSGAVCADSLTEETDALPEGCFWDGYALMCNPDFYPEP